MAEFDTDILIAGGGLAGATLALAIERQVPGLRVLVAETFPLSDEPAADDYQPSYDARSTALAWGSRLVFEQLGLWQAISRQATAIEHIHVSEQGRFGVTRLAARTRGQPALGYVVDNRWLGQCLMAGLQQSAGIEWLAPATVDRVDPVSTGVDVSLTAAGQTRQLRARCLVVADGGRSGLREQLGIATSRRDYHQVALIANVSTERPHQNTAYERFTPNGPMALLPLAQGPVPGHSSALVWTLTPQALDEVLALPQEQQCARLQQVFGWRLGRITRIGEIHHYPLALVTADEWVRPGIALVGNAAHSLHPVAGQGFNLALRGLTALVEAFRFAADNGQSPGDLQVLQRYRRQHYDDQFRTIAFSDSLVRVFGSDSTALAMARSAGLAGLDVMPAAKSWFARQAMGLGGRKDGRSQDSSGQERGTWQ